METRLIESKRNCGYASSKLMKVKNSNKRITKRSIGKKKNDDNSNYKMKKVVVLKTQLQKLYESCQHVFRGPGTIPSPHHVQILRHIIDGMLPKDVGLSPDLHFFNPNNNSSNVKGAAGRVIQTTIYKCNNFSLCIFFLPAASVIPLHNHPGMTVFSKLLLGTMHIKAYDWVVDPIDHHDDDNVSISPSKLRRLAKLKADDVFTAPCDSSVLYPASGGNIHAFTAITPCAVLDVIGPPYSSEDGRDCSYYKDTPYSTPQSNEERSMSMRKVEEEGAEEELYGWLEEIEMPKESTMVGIPYLVPQEVLAKSLLNEYAQKAALPLPLYETVNKGSPHAPLFRSTVIVNNVKYSSSNVFSQRKLAEKDVANIALQSLAPQVMEANCSLDLEDLMFCKSMLNEYATKINAEKPIYRTEQKDGLRPVFVSSLMFDGKHYVGDKARNKKDSEQLAARAVILAIMDSDERMSKIVNSKKMLCAAKDKVKNPCNSQNVAMPVGLQTDSSIEANTAPTISVPPNSEQGINSTSGKKGSARRLSKLRIQWELMLSGRQRTVKTFSTVEESQGPDEVH